MVSEIDKKILNIQRSTKTQFLAFRFIHEWLKARFRPYYIWSVMPYSRIIHWAILLLYISALPVFYGLYNSPGPEKARADTTYDFARWEWTNPKPVGTSMSDVYDGDVANTWFVGGYGTIFKYNGTDWEQQYSGTTNSLLGVSGYGITDVWAVGTDGTILKYNSSTTTWSSQVSNTEVTLNKVGVIDSNTAIIVGEQGVILKTINAGRDWSSVENPAGSTSLKKLFKLSGSKFFAVGDNALIYSDDSGDSWSSINLPTDLNKSYNAIYAASDSEILIGNTGAIYKTLNSGANWSTFITYSGFTALNDFTYDSSRETYMVAGGSDSWEEGEGRTRYSAGYWELPITGGDITPSGGETYVPKEYYRTKVSAYARYVLGSGADIKIDGSSITTGITEYLTDFTVSPTGEVWTQESDGPRWKTTNSGGTWQQLADGGDGWFEYSNIYAIDSQTIWLSPGGVHQTGLSTDGGVSFIDKPLIGNYGSLYSTVDQGAVKAIFNLNGFTVTENGGDTITEVSNPDPTMDVYNISGFGTTTVWAIGNLGKTLKSTDFGNTWTPVSVTDGVTTLEDNLVHIHVISDNITWVASDSGSIAVTSDGGMNWAINSVTLGEENIRDVYGNDELRAWVITSNGRVLKTIDGGETWITVVTDRGYNITKAQIVSPNNIWASIDNSLVNYRAPANATATRLIVEPPGQVFSDGNILQGAPSTQQVGIPFPVGIYAVDEENELDKGSASIVNFTTTDPNDINPTQIQLTNEGRCSQSEPIPEYPCGVGSAYFNFHTPGTWTITATDAGGKVGISSPITVLAGPPSDFTFTKHQDFGANPKPGQSRPLTLSLKDLYGNVASNEDGATITFSGPSHGRFSTSPTGPWSESLTTTIPAGNTSLNLYYIDYEMGTSTITASAFGKQKTLDITIDQGDIDPAASHTTLSSNSLSAGQTASIFTNLVDVNGKKVAGKTVKYYSSRNGDNITQPVSATDGNGDTLGFISSYKGGDLYISTLDETDGVWLLDRPKLTYVALPVKEDVPETAITTPPATTKPKENNDLLNDLRNNAIAKKLANVLNPFVAATAALGLVPLIASIVGSAPAALHGLTYGISLTMEAIGVRKRRKTWGKVYDSTTGKGVDLALVRLYDQHNMKLIGTIVTDLKGQYTFQPQPGTYAISVAKDNYLYPTQIFARYGISKINKDASRINSHYLGQPINITDKDDHLNLDIPIDPINKKPTFCRKLKIWSEDTSYLITFGLSFLFMPTLVIGTLLASFVSIVLPGMRNMIVAIVYLLITLIYTLSRMIKSHQHGIVVDEKGTPLSNVMISIFDKVHNTLKESRITDRFGRYSIFASPGQYIIKAEAQNYEFNPDKLKDEIRKSKNKDKFTGQTINLKKEGYINFTIIGRKK